MECDYCNGDVAIFWQNDIKNVDKTLCCKDIAAAHQNNKIENLP